MNLYGPSSEATLKSDKKNYFALNRDGFRQMIFSLNNTVFIPEKQTSVYMEMTQPLQHYFVNSSWNSFYNPKRGVEPEVFIKVIRSGARHVHLKV